MNPRDLLSINIIKKIDGKRLRNKTPKSWNKIVKKLSKKEKKAIKREYINRIPKQYKVYIRSPYWEYRRNRYFREVSRKCAVCDSSLHVQLHHMFYTNYGSEKDEHLVCLCNSHHELFHSLIDTKRDMIQATNDFIIEQRELLEFPKF